MEILKAAKENGGLAVLKGI